MSFECEVERMEGVETKKCKGECGEEKPSTLEYFYSDHSVSCGLRAKCKVCICTYQNERLQKVINSDGAEKYYEGRKKYNNDWLAKPENKEAQNKRSREWARKNRRRQVIYNKKHRKENREHYCQRERERHQNDPQVRLVNCLRSRVYVAIVKKSGTKKTASTFDLVGCTPEQLKQHLEDQFQEGMSWDNYGNPNGDHTECWHVDHIRPCASFDLTHKDQQRACFHYSNLQPLWAKENLSKGDKWEGEEDED